MKMKMRSTKPCPNTNGNSSPTSAYRPFVFTLVDDKLLSEHEIFKNQVLFSHEYGFQGFKKKHDDGFQENISKISVKEAFKSDHSEFT